MALAIIFMLTTFKFTRHAGLPYPPKLTISVCVQDIKTCLKSNFLKLNMDKTEIIIIGTPLLTTKIPADFTCNITGTQIAPSSIVRNLCVNV